MPDERNEHLRIPLGVLARDLVGVGVLEQANTDPAELRLPHSVRYPQRRRLLRYVQSRVGLPLDAAALSAAGSAGVETLGIAITAAGLLFTIWARTYLGRNWSGTVTVKVGHQLIRSGPYRWVRHPIYSGLILATIGTAIVRGQVRGIVAVVLLWIGFVMKSRIEERVMAATFGPEYEEYSRTTGAIVPRLKF